MSTEARYWEEYGRSKAEALRRAALLSAREKGYLVRSVRNSLVNEVAHDATKQRRFERKFLSLEFPFDDGIPRDYSFGNRELNRMIRTLDEPYWERVREHRFQAALWRLRKHPSLCRTLRAIRTHLIRSTIIAALGIPESTYRNRFAAIARLLGIRI